MKPLLFSLGFTFACFAPTTRAEAQLYPLTYTSGYAPTCQAQVNYAPQTTYQNVLVQVPVTTYRPMIATNYSGQPYTYYEPVTVMQWQMQQQAYTTYKFVPANQPQPSPMSYSAGGPVSYSAADDLRFEGINTNINQIKGSIGTLNGTIGTLNGNVGRLDGNISRINGNIGAINDEIIRVKEKLKEQENLNSQRK